MKCEFCGKEHDGSYGSGRFCSESCKQQYNSIPKDNKHYCCKFCGREFPKPTSLGAHVSNCKLNPNASKTKKKQHLTRSIHARQKNPIITIKTKCCNCGKEFQQTVTKHEYVRNSMKKCCSIFCAHSYIAKNIDIKVRRKTIRKMLDNGKAVGFCKPTKPRYCENCRKQIVDPNFKNSKYCSVDCRITARHAKLSKLAKISNLGGNTEGYKKAKHGWYKGFYCGSSWELAFLLWALDNKLNISRCNKVFEYEFEGKMRKYYPDFEIDGLIYEIKGYEDKYAKAKHLAFPNIIVLKYAEMKDKLEYVKNTYSKDFINMLESKHD